MKRILSILVGIVISLQLYGQTTLSSSAQTVCAGANVSVTANNATPNVTYTWTAAGQASVSGALLTLNAVSQSITWTCTTYDASGTPIDSDAFNLTVNALPGVPTVSNVNYCQNATATALSATGDAGNTLNWVSIPISQTTYDASQTMSNGIYSVGQSFTPQTAMSISGIVYYFDNVYNNQAPLTLTIYQGQGLGGTVLSTVNFTGTINTGEFTFNLPSALNLTQGQVYTFNMTTTASNPLTIRWNQSDVYPYGYYWRYGSAFTSSDIYFRVLTASTNVAPTPSTASAGTTTYLVNQSNPSTGCSSANATLNVTVNALPTVSAGQNQAVCAGTAVTLSGSGAASYTWNNGVTNAVAFTPNATTTYTVTGTAANGCTNTAQTTVTVNALPTVSAGSNQTVCSGTSVTLSGSGAASYTWNNGVTNAIAFTPNATTTYTVTGTAANGCTNTAQTTVTVNALPSVSAGLNQTVCAGTSVTLSGSGAASYTWNNGVTNAVAFTPNATTTYTVTGTAANGCTNTAQTTVTVNALPTVGAGSNQTVCAGTQVTLSGSGAASYTWNNGVTNAVAFTPNATTTYTVTGTAANGCTNTAQTTVTVNALPTVSAGQNQAVCAGTSVTLSGSGAASYTWNNGVTNAVAFTPNTTTTYTVTGTDANGCTNTAQTTVTVNPLPDSTISTNGPTVFCSGGNVELSVPQVNNTTYSWSLNGTAIPGGVGSIYFANQTGIYAVTIVNQYGCSSNDSMAVSSLTNPTAFISNSSPSSFFCQGSQVTLNSNSNCIGCNLSYQWLNNSLNPIAGANSATYSFTVNATSNYYLVTSNNLNGVSCMDTSTSLLITMISYVLPTFSLPDSICINNTYSLPQLSNNLISGNWNHPSITGQNTTYIFSPLVGQCALPFSWNVDIVQLPIPNLGNDTTICSGDPLSLSLSGYSSYLWSNGSNNSSIQVNPMSTELFSVSVTNNFGCVGFDSLSVTVNPNPATPVIVGPESVCLNSLNQVYSSSPTSNWLIWNIDGANIYSGQYTNNVHLDFTATDTVWLELTEHVLSTGCFATGSLMVLVDTNAAAPAYVNVFPLGNQNDMLSAPQATNVFRWGKINKFTNDIFLEPSVLIYHNFTLLDTATYYYFVDHGVEGCFTRSFYNYPELITGIEESNDFSFWLAPNPVISEFKIMSESMKLVEIQVENIEGKCVYSGLNWTNTPINCAQFNPGIYFVKIHNGINSHIVKFLKL